jgi:hypothetical protein
MTTVERQFTPVDPLDGIIAYLTRKCGGNVHKRGVVKLIPGLSGDDVIFDLQSDSCYKITPDTWSTEQEGIMYEAGPTKWAMNLERRLTVDFQDLRVIPTHYTVAFGPGHTLSSWKLSGWEGPPKSEFSTVVIDDRDGVCDISTQTFEVQKSQSCRRLVFGDNGLCKQGDKFVIRAFEVFGTLLEPAE